MKAEELINNNSLSTRDLPYVINQDGKDQEVVFKEVALTAVNMARKEKPEHIDTVQDCELAVRVTKERAVEAFTQVIREEFEYRGFPSYLVEEFKKKLEE